MDIHSIKGTLNIAKGRLKQKLANLSGDKYHLTEGKQDEQIGRLQKRAAENRKATGKTGKPLPDQKKSN
jgi:uncharacterized protein YjbJ (UPF0337 family)